MLLFEYLRSPYEIEMDESHIRAALDLLVRFDIPFYHLKMGKERASFRLYAPYYREYAEKRRERRFAGEVRRRLGLMPLLERYQARAGLFVGALLALFILVFSSLFVWDIRISGTQTIPETVILDALEEKGLYIGAFIPKTNTEYAEGALQLSVDGLSFVSINLRGTVAVVEIRERETNIEPIDTESPSNLIAEMDGQIEQIEITGGVQKVSRGQIVKKGDILVSGIIDSTALGFRTVRARGLVTARTSLSFSAEIPLTVTQKVYTGKTQTKTAVKFFAKQINFYKKDSFSDALCDIIEEERRIYLFGTIKLPIFLIRTTYAFYEETPRTLTEDEALSLAKGQIREQSADALADAEILGRHSEYRIEGDVLFLSETVDCIVDIGEEVKLSTS